MNYSQIPHRMIASDEIYKEEGVEARECRRAVSYAQPHQIREKERSQNATLKIKQRQTKTKKCQCKSCAKFTQKGGSLC